MSSLQRILIILLVAIATLVVSGSAVADRIELRRSIRRPSADQPLRLEDVARLDGEHACRFRHLVVLPAGTRAGRVAEVTIGEIRDLLDEAGIDWPRVELSGGVVAVRPAVRSASGSPVAGSSPRSSSRISPDESASPSGLRSVSEWRSQPDGSLGRQVAELVVEAIGRIESDPDRLFFSMDSTGVDRLTSRAQEIRATLVPDHRAENERPWDSVLLRVQGRRSGDDWRSAHLRVEIGVLKVVPVAVRDIRKGRRIGEGDQDVRLEARPIRPSEVILDPSVIAGRKTISSVPAGEPILSAFLEPEEIVGRGAMIMIRSIIDGHEFNCLVECLQDGCLGELVKCRTTSGESMLARVVGPNLAEIKSNP